MADKIVAEYTVKVDKALKDLDKLAKRVDKVDDERKKTQDGFKSMSNGMVADFKKVGAAIGLAFGVDQLVSFGREAVKVAAQAEGVRAAFNRLNRPDLLNELRRATRGTVDDLTLMRQAVRAENFKVPLEQLGKFFDFATQRSIQTGESVDYLVNSIIDGIGRKSTLVLDNLGISATELQEEMKKTGDFGAAAGNIIARELEKAGGVADTTAIKIEKVTAAFENIKVVIGSEFINQINSFVDELSITEEKITELTGATDKFSIVSFFAGNVMKAILEPFRAINDLVNEGIDIYNLAADGLGNLTDELQEAAYRLTLNNDELIEFNKLGEEAKKIIVDQWLGLKDYADFSDDAARATEYMNEVLRKQKQEAEDGKKSQEILIKNLAYYNNLIKELRAEQEGANTTRARVRELEDEINEGIRQRLILLGKLREVGGATYEQIETIAATEVSTQQQITDEIVDDYERRNAEIERLIEERNAFEANLAKERQEQELQEWQTYASTISNISQSISQIQQAFNQQQLDSLKYQLEQGEITREEYDEKRRQILTQQAEDRKAAAIFDATVSGFSAVVQAYNTDPTGILAGITAAVVAAQIAAISAQPIPQYEEGGFVDSYGKIIGRKHKQGGVKIEAEGGEFITSAKYASQNAEILKAINSGQWEQYKMKNIIAPAINQIMEGGFEGLGKSAQLNGITAKLKDHNIIHSQDRMRQEFRRGFMFLAAEQKKLFKNKNRGGYRA